MKALDRLEGFIREMVERPAALLGSRRLHPMEMAAAVTRALEGGALPLADRVLVPDVYTIQLHQDDFARFAGARQTLEREFAEYVHRLALERGLTLSAPATVTIQPGTGPRPGTVQVQTRYSDHAATPASPARRDKPASRPTGAGPLHTEGLAPPRGAPSPPAPAPRPDGAAVAWALETLDEGGHVLQRHPLGESGVIIGRNTEAGLTVADPEVSRRHARIDFVAPRFYLQDLGSTNGTLVNGRKVSGRHPLADGDTIHVGRSRLRVRRGG